MSKKLLKQWAFPIVVLGIIGILACFNTDMAADSLFKSGKIILSLLPVFALVVIIMTLTNKYTDTRKIASVLGRTSGIKGTMIATVSSIISMGTIYMWYPLLEELRNKGASWNNIAVFLYNRAVKIPLLPVMIAYFGLTFVIVLLVVMICASLLQGAFINAILERKEEIQ